MTGPLRIEKICLVLCHSKFSMGFEHWLLLVLSEHFTSQAYLYCLGICMSWKTNDQADYSTSGSGSVSLKGSCEKSEAENWIQLKSSYKGKCLLGFLILIRKCVATYLKKLKLEVTYKILKFKITLKGEMETSLVVQRLRIHLLMQGTWVQSLLRELRSHMPHDT